MNFPNRENIDRWLFDFTEGNLSAEQETILDNYILNNPDIEIDLDAWQSAKLTNQEISLPNKENYKRKRRIAPVNFLSLIILLSIGTVWILNSSQLEPNKTSAKIDNAFKKTEFKKEIFTSKNNSIGNISKVFENNSQVENGEQLEVSLSTSNEFTPSLIKPDINQIDFALNSNYFQNSTQNLGDKKLSDYSISESDFTQTTQSYLPKLNLKIIDSKTLKLDYYQIRNEELQLNETDNLGEGINLELGKFKIFQKVGKILEKDLGLSNIPDHNYSIPEYSNIDVLFSNIGATSQFRFQSTSMARWIESVDQRKFSQQITLDGYSRGAQSGFGLQANYDYFANGSIQNWNTCLLFSPKLALSRSVSLEPALRLKIGNKLLNEDRITNHSIVNYENQTANQFNFDSSIAIGSKLWYRDLDFGLTINTPYFYIGGQVSNVLRHQNNIYSNYENLDMRANNVYNAVIGTQYISRNHKIQFSPYAFFERINTNRFFAGFNLKLYKLMLGGSYGTGNTISASVGLTFKNFTLCTQSSYAYSTAIDQNSFIHQLTLRFNSNVDKKSRRYITF